MPYPLGAVRALGGKTNVLLTISRTATVCPADVRCGSKCELADCLRHSPIDCRKRTSLRSGEWDTRGKKALESYRMIFCPTFR